MFTLSKLAWPFIQPDSVFVELLVLGIVLLWTRWRGSGRIIVTVVVCLLVAAAILPIDWWAMAPLEDRFPEMRVPPAHVDGIIVLGGAVDPVQTGRRSIPSMSGTAEVMTTFVALARLYPDARLVFSGGSGDLSSGGLQEADVARQLFNQLGLDTSKVTFERSSRNTSENARFSKHLVDPLPSQTWILITSAGHMPRSVGVFRHEGWPVLPWPVAYKSYGEYRVGLAMHLEGLDDATHEWAGLVAYWLLGRTDSLFPGPS